MRNSRCSQSEAFSLRNLYIHAVVRQYNCLSPLVTLFAFPKKQTLSFKIYGYTFKGRNSGIFILSSLSMGSTLKLVEPTVCFSDPWHVKTN